MQHGTLASGNHYTISSEGALLIDGGILNFRDSAFLTYYFVRAGHAEEAASAIGWLAGETEGRFLESAMWIWLVGEYTNRTGDKRLADQYDAQIGGGIQYLVREWMTPRRDWLGLLGEDIYASNIAAVYGAVLSVTNFVDHVEARRLLKDLKAFTFKNFLVTGKLVSAASHREIMGDIGIIAVPFGLIDAGNQILVESMKVLEERLVGEGVRYSAGECERNDLTCLLSWYYSERGDIARAKWLLSQAGKLRERQAPAQRSANFSYILDSIARLNIAEKEKVAWTSEGAGIIHNPEGTGNRYITEPIQRMPIYPLEDEDVVVRMVAQPLDPSRKAVVAYTVDGISQMARMEFKTNNDGESYWEAHLGGFPYGSEVEYRFAVEGGGEKTVSDTYRFIVRRWTAAGSIVGAIRETDGITLYYEAMERGLHPALRFTKVGERSVKMSFFMDAVERFPKEPEGLSFKASGVTVEIADGRLCIDAGNGLRTDAGCAFLELLTDGSNTVYTARYNFAISPDERFFGMGERFSRIEYRGLDIDNYVYNEYTNQKLRTYIPVPFAISTKSYAVFADTPMFSVFRFGTRLEDVLEIEADLSKRTQQLDTFLFTGSAREILTGFSEVAGKPLLPPKWAFGPWMSSNNWDSQAETLKQAELTEKHAIPATVLVLEQWSDEATYYIFNDAGYQQKDGSDRFEYKDFLFPEWGRWPDPKGMVERLHEKGLKVLLWQVPVMKHMDGIAHSQRDEDERFMLEAEYCVKKNGRPYRIPTYEWFKRSLVPDFTNPPVGEWWLGKRRYLLEEVKIDGFKTDGGECIFGSSVNFYDGRTGDEMRNGYPNEYIKRYYDYANVYREDGAVTFSRAGYTGAQRMPLHWAGDEFSTFEAYRASLNAGLSCGMSGIPFWGWDLGGFHGEIPSAELFIRGAQFAAFCPVMQYHAETRGEQNRDRTPWNIAERTGAPYVLSLYKALADLRMNMLPYIYEHAKVCCATGLPMMRMMNVEHPQDERCMDMNGQYYFGENLLVAPVTEEGACEKEVYFPGGKWAGFIDGEERYVGRCDACVECGIKKIPVYIRQDSVIPLNLAGSLTLCSHVGNLTSGYQNLCFLLFINGRAVYRFDDEVGNRIHIEAVRTDESLTINVTGKAVQPVVFIARSAGQPYILAEKEGGKLIACHEKRALQIGEYCVEGRDILIKISGDTETQLICR